MAVTRIGWGGIAGNPANTTARFTAPAGCAADDLAVMGVIYNQPTVVPPVPTGWTGGPTVTISSGAQVKLFWKWLTGAESGTYQGWTSTDGAATEWPVSSRKGIAWEISRGVDKTAWNSAVDAERFATATSINAASTTCPTLTKTGTAVLSSMCLERSSVPSTGTDVAAPAGHALSPNINYVPGTGICQAFIADLLTDDADGTVGSGAWSHAAAGNILVATVRLPVAAPALTTVHPDTVIAAGSWAAAGGAATVAAALDAGDSTYAVLTGPATDQAMTVSASQTLGPGGVGVSVRAARDAGTTSATLTAILRDSGGAVVSTGPAWSLTTTPTTYVHRLTDPEATALTVRSGLRWEIRGTVT